MNWSPFPSPDIATVATGQVPRAGLTPTRMAASIAAPPPNPELDKALEAVKTPEDSAKLPFFPRAMLATAAAWSPDPNLPPLYLDLPTKDGQPQPEVLAKWTANAPLAVRSEERREGKEG